MLTARAAPPTCTHSRLSTYRCLARLEVLPQPPKTSPLAPLRAQPEHLAVTAPLPQLNFSEDLYFENSLQNLKVGAQRSLRKLREKVDPNL